MIWDKHAQRERYERRAVKARSKFREIQRRLNNPRKTLRTDAHNYDDYLAEEHVYECLLVDPGNLESAATAADFLLHAIHHPSQPREIHDHAYFAARWRDHMWSVLAELGIQRD